MAAKKDASEKRCTAARDIDEYLATVPEDAKAALERLRKIIKSAAPKATETISYQIPTFKHEGGLVGFAAFKNHCSFFPMSGTIAGELAASLKGYATTKGSIHFTASKPIPATLVRRIVRARIAENEARQDGPQALNSRAARIGAWLRS